jgi:hypothetical protein
MLARRVVTASLSFPVTMRIRFTALDVRRGSIVRGTPRERVEGGISPACAL